jgi:hypothetical protein
MRKIVHRSSVAFGFARQALQAGRQKMPMLPDCVLSNGVASFTMAL